MHTSKRKKSGFSSRASVLPVSDRLSVINAAAPLDPCKADLLANGLNHPYGFGARAMKLADELQLAAYFNTSVAICDGNAEDPGIEWAQHFQNLAGLEVCSARFLNTAQLGSAMSKVLRKVDHGFQLQLKRQLYNMLFTYAPDTQAHVDAALVAAGIDFGMRYVGVHVRRGDKRDTREVPTKVYAVEVARALRSHQLHVVFIASDDPGTVAEMRSLLEFEVPDVQLIQTYSPTSTTRAYNGANSEAMLTLLTDLEALRRADVFVGSMKSYTGRTAYFLRGEASSVSIDGDWLKGIDLMADAGGTY